MKPSGVCLLFTCYLAITVATEFAQERNVQQFGDAAVKNVAPYCRGPALFADGDVLVQAETEFSDLPQSARARSRAVFNLGGKRANQFKNLMLGRETAKDASSRVQKGSYIPVKSSGKRGSFPPIVHGIYTGLNDMDVFRKWLSSYYLQQL